MNPHPGFFVEDSKGRRHPAPNFETAVYMSRRHDGDAKVIEVYQVIDSGGYVQTRVDDCTPRVRDFLSRFDADVIYSGRV